MKQKKTKVFFTLGSHLDLFWMGNMRDCLDKGCQIINRAIELCDAYTEYCFYIETTVFAEYFLENFPEQRDKFIELAQRGRFEIGCSYADRFEHYYGGEAIARHHITAKRWLQNLGITSISTCHADLPGLSPQIPQICAESGISYYMRARGPCGIYDWSAPDGTHLIYCSLGYTYDKIKPENIKTLADSIEAGSTNLPYYIMRGGYTDLEMPDSQIISDIKKFSEIFPKLDFAVSSPSNVIKYYMDNPKIMADIPKISGEWPSGWGSASAGFVKSYQKDLYLENYLLAAEKITALSQLYGGSLNINIKEAKWETVLNRLSWGERSPGKIKDGEEFDEMWKALLRNHDHNIGGYAGGKTETDRTVMKFYCEEYANEIVNCGMSYINNHIAVPEAIKNKNPLARVVLFNQMAWNRNVIVTADLSGIKSSLSEKFDLLDKCGNSVLYDIKDNELTFAAENLPSLGFEAYYIAKQAKPANTASWCKETRRNDIYILETPFYTVSVEEKTGVILSVYDKKTGKELIENTDDGNFGGIVSYEESGSDVIYGFTGKKTRDIPYGNGIKIVKNNLSVTVETQSEICDSKIIKKYIFYKDRPEINIKITIFWWGKLYEHLRLCMPFAPENFKATSYGTPFYAMEWPQMMNGIDDDTVLGVGNIRTDELDAHSRLHIREVCKWIDVGYDRYGVAIGMKTSPAYMDNNNIEPILLRTGHSCGDFHMKDKNDGRQEFEYTLLPHSGDWKKAGIYRFGWENTNAPICYISDITDSADSYNIINIGEEQFSTDKSNVIITALKTAYDMPDAFALRFFETDTSEGDIILRCPKNVISAKDVNMLEEEKSDLQFNGHKITIPVKPYQIKTVLFQMEK